MIQAILLTNNQIIISQCIPESDEDNESYFSLMYPYLFTTTSKNKSGFKLTPWLSEVTVDTEKFMVYPDKIITMKEPNSTIVNHYKKLVLFDEEKVIEPEKEVVKLEFIPALEDDNNRNISEEVIEVLDDTVDEVYEEDEAWDFTQM